MQWCTKIDKYEVLQSFPFSCIVFVFLFFSLSLCMYMYLSSLSLFVFVSSLWKASRKKVQKVRAKKVGMVDQYLLSSRLNPSLPFHFSVFVFVFSSLYFFVFLCLPLPWSEECRRGSESEEISRHTQPLSSYQAHSNPSHLSLCLCLCVCICVFVILCLYKWTESESEKISRPTRPLSS